MKDMTSLTLGKKEVLVDQDFSDLHFDLKSGEDNKSSSFYFSIFRKLREQNNNIEIELERIFSTPVTAAIEEAPADSPTPELTATIVLSVLLACTLIAFLVYVLFTMKRKRYIQFYFNNAI